MASSFRIVLLIEFLLLCGGRASAFNPLDTNHRYDYVILTADDLLTQAQRLETHRSARYRTCLVRLSEVTSAFPGASTTAKIRNFVGYAYENWKIAPTYLVLLGDANMSNSTYDVIPTLLRYNEFFSWDGNRYFADDGYYVESRHADEKRPIMHIGRIPARTTSQLSNAIDKLIAYDQITGSPTWLRKSLMLVGDKNINANNAVFRIMNDNLREEEFADWNPSDLVTLYSSSYQGDDWREQATAVTRAAWNNPAHALVNGFGNTNDFSYFVHMADFNLLPTGSGDPTFTEGLSATGYLPVVFGGTCIFNYFYRDIDLCVGEDLILSAPNRGAIAAIGSTHVNDIVESYGINRIFAHELLHEGVRNVGRLFSSARGLYLADELGHETLAQQYCLLGDPGTDLKIYPLPTPTSFANGVEIEDAPILQDTGVAKSSGITSDNSRIVHIDGEIAPLQWDRMLRAKLVDGGSSADFAEWKIQDLNLPIKNNMILSFWINVAESPAGADRIILDGNTTGGRIKDNADIFDQNGIRLDARSRTPLPAGWQFIYADLSPLKNSTLTDLRIRYESATGSETGPLTAYFDNFHVESYEVPGHDESEEGLNFSFEDDVDKNGTPDFWTSVAGLTQTGTALRSDTFAFDGNYSLAACNPYCQTGEGAQQIIFANEDIARYTYGFYCKSAEATSFRFKIVDASDGSVLINENLNATTSWQYMDGSFMNPGYDLAPRRLRVQFLPNDCQRPVWIDQLSIYQSQVVAVPTLEPTRSVGAQIIGVSPNPLSAQGQLQVRLQVARPSEVSIEAFDARGRMVESRDSEFISAGEHLIPWQDFGASSMAAGRY